MSAAVDTFVSRLRAYDPTGDSSPIATLYTLVAPIENDGSAPDAFAHIFAFFEKYPDADLGAPGPLVHLLERHVGKYEILLAASLKKAPSSASVTMANRILNTQRTVGERSALMAALSEVARSRAVPEIVREQAAHYREFQKPS